MLSPWSNIAASSTMSYSCSFWQELARPTKRRIEEAKVLHPAFYTDQSYAQIERERLFGMNWFAAAHVHEVSNPGDVKVIEVGKTSIILTCDKDRKLHAFYNSCRHRGARVCSTSTTGCKQLVCPYHWWAYRLDGSLKATPPAALPKESRNFQDLGLLPIPGLETFAGLVFLNQLPNPPPLRDFLGDLPEKLQRYDLEGLSKLKNAVRHSATQKLFRKICNQTQKPCGEDDMELFSQKKYDIGGDWKLIAENFVDFYHIDAVHPELSRFSRVDDHLPYQGDGQYVGFVTSPLTDCGGPGDSVKFNRFPRLREVESQAALFFHIFPNVSVTIYPHSVYTLLTLPSKTPGRTEEPDKFDDLVCTCTHNTLQSFSFEKAAVLNVAAKLNVSIRHFHGHVRKVKLANTTAGGHFTMPSRRGALSSCGEDDNAITVWTTEDAPDKAQKIVAASNADVPDAEVVVEAIHSYYWWDGKVHFDPEWRVAVTTVAPFETVKDAIGKVHSYDLPMMIYNLADVPDQHMYWKGIVQLSTHDATELAEPWHVKHSSCFTILS
eukprot:g23507.t1